MEILKSFLTESAAKYFLWNFKNCVYLICICRNFSLFKLRGVSSFFFFCQDYNIFYFVCLSICLFVLQIILRYTAANRFERQLNDIAASHARIRISKKNEDFFAPFSKKSGFPYCVFESVFPCPHVYTNMIQLKTLGFSYIHTCTCALHVYNGFIRIFLIKENVFFRYGRFQPHLLKRCFRAPKPEVFESGLQAVDS